MSTSCSVIMMELLYPSCIVRSTKREGIELVRVV